MQKEKKIGNFIFDDNNPFKIGTGDSIEFTDGFGTYNLEIITGDFKGTTVFIQGQTFEGKLDLITKKGWVRDVNRFDNCPSWLVLYLGVNKPQFTDFQDILPMYGFSKKDIDNNFINFNDEF